MRPRFRPTRPISFVLWLTTAERDAMVAFVNDELAGGALPFRFPVQPLESGGTWLVRFADDLPSWSPVGTRWRVGLSLEIMP